VSQKRPALFRGRHFQDVVVVLCVRWYLPYSLSYRDLEEMMAERGLTLDHCHDLALGTALWIAPG
jgi:transposase, IS6 family